MATTREDLVAVVTGGAAGIGQALARRLAELGAAVVVADIDDAAETVQLIEEAGGRAIGVRGDTSDVSAVEELRRLTQDRFGVVNVVVNNAAIMPPRAFLDIPVEEWDRVQTVNLRSSFLVARAFLPGMKELGWGRVVQIASTSFFSPPPGMVSYITSKGSVIAFTRALAAEVGDWGVNVNAIAPGGVVTPGTVNAGFAPSFEQYAGLQNIKRVGRPDDLAGVLAFLVSEDAGFITGQTLVVDGGYAHV